MYKPSNLNSLSWRGGIAFYIQLLMCLSVLLLINLLPIAHIFNNFVIFVRREKWRQAHTRDQNVRHQLMCDRHQTSARYNYTVNEEASWLFNPAYCIHPVFTSHLVGNLGEDRDLYLSYGFSYRRDEIKLFPVNSYSLEAYVSCISLSCKLCRS